MRCQAISLMLPFGMLFSAQAGISAPAFPEGVASGDVTNSAAVVWTRLAGGGEVRLEVATDESFGHIVHTASTSADSPTDFAVKFDVPNLLPATEYFFHFVDVSTAEPSMDGHFKTAPAADATTAFRFVYSGDSDAADQPFRVLQYATDDAPDLWFWAGDTIYGDDSAGGLPPATTLSDYQAKHRQNRADSFLQNLLRASPVWAQWDDHEVANDYDGGDVEPEIGQARVVAGQSAFFDYMPIRPQQVMDDPRRIYRSFRYGSLAEFFILDCRQYRSADLSREGGGPDPRAYFIPIPQFDIIAKLQDPSRTMLGKPQLEWLKNGLKASGAKWKFVLSSVPLTSLMVLPYDRWDGYEAERYELLRYLDTEAISGVVILSADIHANIYNPDVTRFQRDHLGADYSPCFAVPEFVAGPIATNTFRQEVRDIGAFLFGSTPADFGESVFFNTVFGSVVLRVAYENKLSFVETDRFAYLLVDVTPDGVTFTHKATISDSTIADPPLEILNTVTLTEDPKPNCGLGLGIPGCMVFLMCTTCRSRIRRPASRKSFGSESVTT